MEKPCEECGKPLSDCRSAANVEKARAGSTAWLKGAPLNSNPFDFDREHDEWSAWRSGWIQTSEDHLAPPQPQENLS